MFTYPKSSSFTFGVQSSRGIYYLCNSVSCDHKALPIGGRNVGQGSMWKDESGRFLSFILYKFDTNSDAISIFPNETKRCKAQIDSFKKTLVDYDCGSAGVGEYSFYEYEVRKEQPDIGRVVFKFLHNNDYVYIQYQNEKEKTMSEVIRIAKNIDSRLD